MIETDSNYVWVFGMPLERLPDGTYCQRAGGRPSGSGTYGEHTTLMRIPDSVLDEVKAILERRKQEWDKIRERVQAFAYTTPGLDLNTIRIVPRPASAPAPACAPTSDVVTENRSDVKIVTTYTDGTNAQNKFPNPFNGKRKKRR